MNFQSYLHYTVFLTFLSLAVYAIIKKPNAIFNRYCMVLFLSMALWSLGFAFINNPYVTREQLLPVFQIASIANINVSISAFAVIMLFIEKRKFIQYYAYFNVIFLLIYAYFQLNGEAAIITNNNNSYGFWHIYYENLVVIAIFGSIYYSLLIIAIVKLKQYINNTTKKYKVAQAKIIYWTSLISFGLVIANLHIPQKLGVFFPVIPDVFLLLVALAFVYSITKHKLFEVSPSRLANTIINMMPAGLIIGNSENKIVDVNQFFLKLSGYKKDEIIDQDINTFSYEIFKEKPQNNSYIDLNRQFVLYTKHGVKRYVRFYSQSISKNKNIDNGFICFYEDISGIKKAENKLKQLNTDLEKIIKQRTRELRIAKENAETNEARFKELAELLPETVFEIDIAHNLTFINKAGLEKFKYSKQDYENGINFMNCFVDEEEKKIQDALNKSLEGNKPTGNEYQARCKDDTTFPAIIYNAPIKNNHSIIGLRGILTDISDIKKAEKLNKEKKLAQKTAEVKHRLLANISHEMRTPMNGIIGMIDFLNGTNLDTQQKEYINTIKDSSESLLQIINDVLDLSKIEQGMTVVNYENIDIFNLLENIYKNFKNQSLAKNIKLHLDIQETFPKYLQLDTKHFRQVIHNLLSNAIKYTEKGYIKIHLISVQQTSNIVTGKIIVKDTGVGISNENKDKIFEPFMRVEEDSYTRVAEGTGLGLSITKNLVALLGGEINVDSEPGKGSKFWFTFTSKIVDASQLKAIDEPINDISGLNLRILYAEDKKVNQKVTKMILEKNGCTVVIAKNGKEAVEIFDNDNNFNIILMDIMMPVMDGIQAMKELRSKYENLPPVIGLSAHALEGDAKKYMALGMNDYLVKPIDKVKMFNKLYKWGR